MLINSDLNEKEMLTNSKKQLLKITKPIITLYIWRQEPKAKMATSNGS